LPHHLRALAGTGRLVEVDVAGTPTQRSVIDALESAYPALEGTIRDRTTKLRRPLVRFYACEEDLSDAQPDEPLPAEVVAGKEPFLIIGAMAGG
ncbi:MAG TPA: MoaD/ThiS family protein, partial [Solirubrobacterales bacterium]|nr:MoaD/ThiS family protein [Solirubrobacterales bacterium]